MSCVFINYRRGDTSGEARALFNELVATLGKDSVFMDVDTIALGRDFRQVVRERVETCDLMLALIGREWIGSKDNSGKRRLDDSNDFVRMEIAAALRRDIPVTPVLVQGAVMPSAEQLPEELRDFAYRNAFELSHNRWESDVHEMVKRLGLSGRAKPERTQEEPPATTTHGVSPPSPPHTTRAEHPGEQTSSAKRRIMVLVTAVVAIALAGGGLFYYRSVVDENARLGQMQQEKARAEAEEARVAAERAEAAAQAERKQLAEAEAERRRQAERKQLAEAETERQRLAEADAERTRLAEADAAKKQQADAEERRHSAASGTTKFSGSMSVSMGHFTRALGIAQPELTTVKTLAPCANWSHELSLDAEEGKIFRATCIRLAQFANDNGWTLGVQPTPQDWMRFCSSRAGTLTGDTRKTFLRTCLKYR